VNIEHRPDGLSYRHQLRIGSRLLTRFLVHRNRQSRPREAINEQRDPGPRRPDPVPDRRRH
jgi:hypothetical protein